MNLTAGTSSDQAQDNLVAARNALAELYDAVDIHDHGSRRELRDMLDQIDDLADRLEDSVGS